GHLLIDEAEAEVVRMLYRWLIDERMTVRQILKRLAAGPWRPRCGRRLWSAAVVHRVLSDPVYTGTGYLNRYTFHAPRRPRAHGPHTGERTCRRPRPREEWIAIPVPAIIDEQTHQQAAAQLARNAALSCRNNKRNDYLLRCLLTCRTCGLAMFGVTNRARGGRPEHRYYQCHGKEGVYRDCHCPRRCVRADELEAAVWRHVKGLLDDPAALLAQFEAFAREADAQKTNDRAEGQKWEGRLRRLDREEQRLVDAYQAEGIDLAELKGRREQIATRRQALAGQREQLARLRDQRRAAQGVWADLRSFCERVRGRLEGATLAERQQLLQLLIERVIVGEDTLEIRHVIPLGRPKLEALAPAQPDGSPGGSGLDEPPRGGEAERLCSDGVVQALLVPGVHELVVRRPAVVDDGAVVVEPQGGLGHGAAAGRVDDVSRRLRADQRVQPGGQAAYPPARLIGHDPFRLAHGLADGLVDGLTTAARPQDGVDAAAAAEVDAEQAVQAADHLAVGEPALLVELHDGRLGVRAQLGGGGPQGVGGLQRGPALEALVAAAAAADMDVDLAMDGAARDLDLVLVRDVDLLDGPTAARADIGQRRLVDFVDVGRWLPMGLGAVIRAGLAAGPLRLGLRRSFGEGGGLALAGALRLLQLAVQAFDLAFKLGDTVP